MTLPPAGESYWDRCGRLITFGQWAALRGDPEYVRVAHDEIGRDAVSTVWIGISLVPFPFLSQAPAIFETMVFPACERCCRYATEDEALAGHEAMCAELRVKASR